MSDRSHKNGRGEGEDIHGRMHTLCDDVCPQEAVRHDSEKVPARVESNMEKAKANMSACIQHLGSEEEGQKCLSRTIKHFMREKSIAEKTVRTLQELSNAEPG